MNQYKPKLRKAALIVAAVLFTATLSAAGWFYHSRLQDVPPPAPARQAARPIGAIMIARPSSAAPPAPAASESGSSEAVRVNQEPQTPDFQFSSADPMKQFRQDTRTALLVKLTPAFPNLPTYLTADMEKGRDPDHRRLVLQLLDGAESAPSDQQPAMLLAADFLADALWCPSEDESRHLCDELRSEFAQRKLTLVHDELGGGSFYMHDLLWRLWRDYPATDWGERAFVLLLDSGWDTSKTCAHGADQFRQVIRQGESFLQQQTNSPNRAFVTHLLGQAYATWWTLSKPPLPGMEDYVDPKLYQLGAEHARLKAIACFEQVLQFGPGTALGEYAGQILPTLRKQQVVQDGYRFFCVYD